MRLLKAVIALIFFALGIVLGALNREPVRIELGFHTIENATLGITMLAALVAGALLAGLVLTVGVIWPMRHRLRRTTAESPPPQAPVAHE